MSVLVIIIIPFALFGIDSYLSSIGDDVYAAKVNGESITIQSYQNALNRVKDQFLNQSTPPDPAIFETAEFRKSVCANNKKLRGLFSMYGHY